MPTPRIPRILHVWSQIETVVIGLCVIAALIVFMGGAAVRVFSPANAVDWAEEVAIYFIIWGSVLSGSTLAAEGRHINTEIVAAALPQRVQKMLTVFVTLLSFCFCFAMLIFGWQAVDFTLMLDERSASSLRTPQAWTVFLALPVGMALICARMVLLALIGRGITSPAEPLLPDRGE